MSSPPLTEFDWSGWTDWTPLAPLDFSVVPTNAGAYAVATDRAIHRAIGIDPQGILDNLPFHPSVPDCNPESER